MDESIIQAFLTLGIIVLFFVGILFFLKRLVKNRNNKSGNYGIEIVSKASIMPKSHIFVIKAEEKTLLIGATDHNISLIADLSAKEEEIKSIRPVKDTKSLALRSNTAKVPRHEPETLKQPINNRMTSKKDLDKALSFSSFLKSAFKRA